MASNENPAWLIAARKAQGLGSSANQAAGVSSGNASYDASRNAVGGTGKTALDVNNQMARVNSNAAQASGGAALSASRNIAHPQKAGLASVDLHKGQPTWADLYSKQQAQVQRENAIRTADAKRAAETAALSAGAQAGSADWVNYLQRSQAQADSANTTATEGLADYSANLKTQEHNQNLSDLQTYSSLLGDNEEAKQALARKILGGESSGAAWTSLFNADGSSKYKVKSDAEKAIEGAAQELLANGLATDLNDAIAKAKAKSASDYEVAQQDAENKRQTQANLNKVKQAISTGRIDTLNDNDIAAAMTDPLLSGDIRSASIGLGTEADLNKSAYSRILASAMPGSLVTIGDDVYRIESIGTGHGADNVMLRSLSGSHKGSTRELDMLDSYRGHMAVYGAK